MRQLASLLLALGGCAQRTEMLVRVFNDDVRIPQEVSALGLQVSEMDGTIIYAESGVALCHDGGMPAGCKSLPVSILLIPGGSSPSAQVDIRVDGLDNISDPVIANAARFVFTVGATLKIDFVMHSRCKGNLTCAERHQICLDNGQCGEAIVEPYTGADGGPVEPDLSGNVLHDFAYNFDFAGPNPDFAAPPPDLSGHDLASCDNTCGANVCGYNACGNFCNTCTGRTICVPVQMQCHACGGRDQLCCLSGNPCDTGLGCNTSSLCEPVDMASGSGFDFGCPACTAGYCTPGPCGLCPCNLNEICSPPEGYICDPCGDVNQECCSGSFCNPPYFCNLTVPYFGQCQASPDMSGGGGFDFSMGGPKDMNGLKPKDMGLSVGLD